MTPTARPWQRLESSSDAYLAVTGLLGVLIVLPIATKDGTPLERVLIALLVGATVTVSMAASRARPFVIHISWIASLAVLVAVLFSGVPRALLTVSGIVLAVLMAATPIVILRRIAGHEIITATTMWGAIAAYLALGMAFSLAYAAIFNADAASFPAVIGAGLGEFNYFSFVTMTTLGYGDITPVTELPRALAILQTLLGQIFLVVVVARVVSLLGRTRPSHRHSASDPE